MTRSAKPVFRRDEDGLVRAKPPEVVWPVVAFRDDRTQPVATIVFLLDEAEESFTRIVVDSSGPSRTDCPVIIALFRWQLMADFVDKVRWPPVRAKPI